SGLAIGNEFSPHFRRIVSIADCGIDACYAPVRRATRVVPFEHCDKNKRRGMVKKWMGLAAVFAALACMVPCALATESDWAYRQQRASERRYERFLRRQELAQRNADRNYDR